MDENSRMYVCAICGKSYEHVEDRVACETKCLKKRKAEEEQKKRNEAREKLTNSTKAIEKKLTEVDEMIKQHLNEFESLELTRNYPYLSYIFKKFTFWL